MTTKIVGKYGSTESAAERANPVGRFAIAEGYRSRASGRYAHAEGYQTSVTGDHGHAEGDRSNSSAAYGGAHAEGERAVASGNSSHAEGYATRANGAHSHAEGSETTSSGSYSHAEGQYCYTYGDAAHAEGTGCYGTGNYSHAEGNSSRADANYSHCQGHYGVASVLYQHAAGAGRFNNSGDAQASTLIMRAETANATPKVLTADAGAPSPTDTGGNLNVLLLPQERAFLFTISVAARRFDLPATISGAGWTFRGLIVRASNASPAAFAATTQVETWSYSADSIAWDVALTIDTSAGANSNYLKLTATGEAAKSIRWLARIDTAEVG